MKRAVIYSSATGNTKKLAEAIHAAMPAGTGLYAVGEAPPPEEFDLLVCGFWIDRGVADAKADAYLKRINGKKVFSFFTLGADPTSDHAQECVAKTPGFYGEGCTSLGVFHCQGAISPKLIEWMKQLPADHPHAADDERRARWARAASHPDQADCAAAAKAVLAAIG